MSLILLQGIRSIATITQMSVSLKFLGLFLPAEYRVDFTTVTSKYTGYIEEWGVNDFEITGEFKISSVGSYRGIICQRNVLGSAGTFALFIDADNSNKLRFQVSTSGGNKSVIHQTAPAANTLYTFKAARHGAYLRLWLDDVESTTPVYIGSETIPPDVTDITVGVVAGGSSYHTLGGRVDNLKIVKFIPV